MLQNWSVSSFGVVHSSWALTQSGKYQSFFTDRPISLRETKPSTPICTKAQFSDGIAQLAHNKVLVAAGVSMAIGQLSKPFTNVVLYGKDFDVKSFLQAGGFPSSHSSATVATATTLGLERGISDSIFGLALVYAGLVMYDAQGVRREVGIHARQLNKTLPQVTSVKTTPAKDRGRLNSQPKPSSSLQLDMLRSLAKSYSSSKATNTKMSQATATQKQIMSSGLGIDAAEAPAPAPAPLKETIGHTEIEVIAGAFLGFIVGLAVYNIL